jgi:hypothetical protein
MPLYWNRTLATDPTSLWNFDRWVPDLVVILLGIHRLLLLRVGQLTHAPFAYPRHE